MSRIDSGLCSKIKTKTDLLAGLLVAGSGFEPLTSGL